MIAVYARANHPKGYGMADGSAHGYVVLFVRCRTRKQIEAVSRRLGGWSTPFHGIDGDWYEGGRLGEWYGGLFELLAILPGNQIDHATDVYGRHLTPGRFRSRGDNRFTGIYEAKELLG